MAIPTKNQFLETCKFQEFPLPMTIMKYIWMNPSSPKIYQKLINSCKLFFIKNPVLVFRNLEYKFGDWQHCIEKECRGFGCEFKSVKLDKIKAKIWVMKKLFIQKYGISKDASAFVPRIFRYNVEAMQLINQELSFNELKIFSMGVKKSGIFNCNVKYNNGEIVPLKNIVLLFSNCKEITICFSKNSKNYICENYDDFINACQTIKKIYLTFTPDEFDVPNFYQHLKNSKNRALFYILSKNEIHRLNEVINEIMQTQSFYFVPPVIDNYHINCILVSKMVLIQTREAAKFF